MKEEDQLLWLCQKITQSYRIRLRLLSQRHQLLLSINSNFNNLANNPQFYSSLAFILNREKKVLNILRNDRRSIANTISSAISHLEKFKQDLRNTPDIHLKDGKTLSTSDLVNFLGNTIRFLNLMQDDYSHIANRIQNEENFLNEKTGRNVKHFQAFISAWKQEMKDNEKLIGHYRNMLSANGKVIKVGEAQGGILIAGGSLGGGAALMAGAALGSPIAAGLGTAVGVAIVLAGFLARILTLYQEEWMIVSQDEKILNQLEQINAIKKPFFRKMFG